MRLEPERRWPQRCLGWASNLASNLAARGHVLSDWGCNQGINRLGKGSAKPGTLRPTDPNRFKTEDFFSVDAEDDPEYLRRVVEVEQLAVNKTGAVLSKGAFDKNDALYLRDEADKARHDELERRDAELAQFARIRSKVETAAAMEPYDPGPALKRAKIAKPKVAIKTAGQPTTTAGSPSRAAIDRCHRDKQIRQDGEAAEGVSKGSNSRPSVPTGTGSGKGARVDDNRPAGLGLQYESSSEDGTEDCPT